MKHTLLNQAKGLVVVFYTILFLNNTSICSYFLYVGTVGRWTREEHLNFIKGLELHGKGWKKIAALIKTRTVVQIRTHAQKYFLKLQKARNESNGKVQNESKMKDGSRKVFNT
jgi:SHAQKYF class myb-like DNA-binding protein